MKDLMNRRDAMKMIGLGFATLRSYSSLASPAASTRQKPNIIFMVADNLGRESVGYYDEIPTKSASGKNKKIATPNMDKLASEGVVFDNCLIAMPLCSPARCGWNTGRNPYRVGITGQTNPRDPESGLSPQEVTIAEILKEAGYDTALFGKWNLGYDVKFNPLYQGFDEYYGSNAGHADYYTHLYNSDMKSHFYHGLKPVEEDGYFDKLFTNAAIEYLRKRRENPRPFYLNLCFYAPHGPYQAPPGYYHSDDPAENHTHMVQYLDLCVGRVMDEVERLGLAENTLVVFLSDQGSSFLNDYGRTLSEGGLKVICNARWKGKIPAGKRVQTPWMHPDLFAVFAGVAGTRIPQDRVIDAEDIWPLFEGKELEHNRTLYWSFKNEDAIRVGDWKLRMIDGKVVGLFNLAADPGEKRDLSAENSQKVSQMRELQAKWKKECEAQRTSVVDSGQGQRKKEEKKEKTKDKTRGKDQVKAQAKEE